MKVRTSLKKICEKCKIVKRGRKVYVRCDANPRHKQRQGFSTLAAAAVMQVQRTPAVGQFLVPPTSVFTDMLVVSEAGEASDVDGT